MSIYFGSTGFIELKRDALNSEIGTSLNPADVNTTKKRFSVENVNGSLITGDQIEIETTDGSNLELLSGHSFPDLRKYIHIDDVGGIKLYDTFAAALAGEVADALTLTAPSSTKDILIRTRNTRFRPLAKITEFEITTTRDIARQILRHRSFSFQEFSQRYADPTEDLEFVMREARLQDNKNRQNSIEIDNANIQENWKMRQSMVMQEVLESYNWAIANGIAKEQARAVLPEGNIESRLYMNGTIRSWIHYI